MVGLFVILLKIVILQEDSAECEKCKLIGVIDGDTIQVLYKGIPEKVRLIGIDAPESVHADQTKNNEYGQLASEYTKKLLVNVEYVYLEFDVSKYDMYDRLLAYVHLKPDISEFKDSLNYILVLDGYAVNKEYEPNTKHAAELRSAYQSACKNGNGLWKYEGFEKLWEQ